MTQIAGRDDEFRATITALFNRFLGHDPNTEQMAAYLTFCRAGGTGEQMAAILAKEPESIAYLSTPPTPTALPRIVATDHGLETDDGKPYVWAHADSFRLLDRMRLGEDVDPVLAELAAVGANGVRVLMDAEWFATRTPDRPDTYDLLPEMAAQLTKHRLYAQLCLFADWQQVWGGQFSPALAHYHRTIEAMRTCPNLIGQLVNEGREHQQHFPFEAFALPEGILCSRGSNGTGQNPPIPYAQTRWTYHDLGSERREDRLALSTTTVYFAVNGYVGEGGGAGFPGTQWCTVVSEPPGIGDGPKRSPDPGVAYLLGKGTRFDPHGRACGGTAHSDDGVQSRMMSAQTRGCVEAFLRGVKA